MKAPTPKTPKDIGIYFLMVFIITFLLALVKFVMDCFFSYEGVLQFEVPWGGLKFYFALFVLFRLIIVMPVTWWFVETFNGKYKNALYLKLLFIIVTSLIIAVIFPSETNPGRGVEGLKRIFFYPIAGILSYVVYTTCFYRKGLRN